MRTGQPRKAKPLSDFEAQMDEVNARLRDQNVGKLQLVELICSRLYTGPMCVTVYPVHCIVLLGPSHPVSCTMYPALFRPIALCTLYHVLCIVRWGHRTGTLYPVLCIVRWGHRFLYPLPCILHLALGPSRAVLCTLYPIPYPIYLVPCTLYHISCIMYPAPCSYSTQQ